MNISFTNLDLLRTSRTVRPAQQQSASALRKPSMNVFSRVTLILMALGMPLAAMAQSSQNPSLLARPGSATPLADKVRNATERFQDVNVAIHEGWVPGTPCVSGPDEGAMGVHFVLPDRLFDGVLNADQPEALIYEPLAGGALRLVGVEFIAIASTVQGAPSLEGHLLNYVSEPNRYGLPAFYELHVWAWEDNPKGSFADWNTNVTCNKQPLS